MNYKIMSRLLSFILLIEGAFMVPALAISFFSRETEAVKGFGFTILIIIGVSAILRLYSFGAKKRFFAKEGIVSAGLCWIALSIFGCLPFYISGEIPKYIDALFETVSGFTTTGASVLSDVEALSNGIQYWRCFSHWLGGMGVLVFLLAIVPIAGKNEGFTMHILRAESPGPDVGKLVPKMRTTAILLYGIYIVLTIICFLFLLAGDMPAFDALCVTFATAGTGGFSVKNTGMAQYSPYIINVCSAFMFLFGVNFSCYYLLLFKKVKAVLKDEELKVYFGVVATSIILIAFNIKNMYTDISQSFMHSAFQVSSIISTTGFATADFDLWPAFSKAILFLLMFFGPCAGSTGGGLKIVRIIILVKSICRNLAQMLKPKNVRLIRVSGKVLDENVVANTNSYFAAYMAIFAVSFIIISLDGFTIGTNASAVAACFNNIGPGFEGVGPMCNFSAYSGISKLVLVIDMLAGRLEIFPILALFSFSSWRKA